MKGSRILAALVVVAGALTNAACHTPKPNGRPTLDPAPALEAVEITSQLRATVGGQSTEITLVGVAAHSRNGLQVIFIVKELVLLEPIDLGPLTVTLNPERRSIGTLTSETFPATHRQDFFLQIRSDRLGTLVSDAPLTLSSRIDGSPPTARYESSGGEVAFYKQGDPERRAVLTVQRVTSDVKPAAIQAVDMTSRVTVTVEDRQASLVFVGRAQHVLRGRNVLFIDKRLDARDPGDLGPLAIVLDPRNPSVGTLGSDTLPALHRQSFFLQIQSERLGTLVSDHPVTVAARIDETPPTATYKLDGEPVAFYRQSDGQRQTVLTIEGVESDVTPARRGY